MEDEERNWDNPRMINQAADHLNLNFPTPSSENWKNDPVDDVLLLDIYDRCNILCVNLQTMKKPRKIKFGLLQ